MEDEEQIPRKPRTRQGGGASRVNPDPAGDPPPEGRATQGTYTEHTDTFNWMFKAAQRPSTLPNSVFPCFVVSHLTL